MFITRKPGEHREFGADRLLRRENVRHNVGFQHLHGDM